MKALTELLVLLALIVREVYKLAYRWAKWYAYEISEAWAYMLYLTNKKYDLAMQVLKRAAARKEARKKASGK